MVSQNKQYRMLNIKTNENWEKNSTNKKKSIQTEREVVKTVNRKNVSVHNFPNSKANVKVGLKSTRMMTALIVKTRPYAFTRIQTFLETQKSLETLKC